MRWTPDYIFLRLELPVPWTSNRTRHSTLSLVGEDSGIPVPWSRTISKRLHNLKRPWLHPTALHTHPHIEVICFRPFPNLDPYVQNIIWWTVGSPIPGLRRMHTIYLHTIRQLMRTTVDLDDYFQFVTRVYHSFLFFCSWNHGTGVYDVIRYRCPIEFFLVTIRISTMTNETDFAVYPISSIFGIRTPIFGIVIRYY